MAVVTSMLMGQVTAASAPSTDSVDAAAGRLYDAECAFHNASQTQVDTWILAASNRLHVAIAVYLAAVAASVAVAS